MNIVLTFPLVDLPQLFREFVIPLTSRESLLGRRIEIDGSRFDRRLASRLIPFLQRLLRDIQSRFRRVHSRGRDTSSALQRVHGKLCVVVFLQ